MFKTLLQDRSNIENKYHLLSERYNPHNRFGYHGYEYDNSTGLSDEEIDKKLQFLCEQMEGVCHPIFKAKLFECVLDNTMIDVNEKDYFVGIYTWGRILKKHTIAKWEKEVTDSVPESKKVFQELDSVGAGFGWLDFDHTVPDWDFLMEKGFVGVLERLDTVYNRLKSEGEITKKQEEFYEAAVIEYKAIIRLLDRFYNYAMTKKFAKAAEIAKCIKSLRDGAPTNTYEALQLIYIYFMLSESIDNYQVRSLGYGLDSTLYPFYEKDIANGTYTKEEIGEFIGYFMMQWSSIDNYWGQPLYLGGVKKDGTTKVTELSHMILDVYYELGIFNPKIQIIYDKSTPKDFVIKALEMIRNNVSSIVFVNQEIATKSLMANGATYDEAIDTVISGCYEYNIKDGDIGIGCIYVNVPKAVTFVIDNGFDEKSGKQIGLQTGELDGFKTFEDFYGAFLKQMEFLILKYFNALDAQQPMVSEINPSLMFSALSTRCADKLTDALDCGLENSTGILLCGFASAVDALMVIYELVYEKKIATLKDFKNALDNNWEGYEKLRLMAQNSSHKYGNNDSLADHYADSIARQFARICAGLRNSHGGKVNVEMHSALAFVRHGKVAKATADGRCYGDEFSKNGSPVPGADRNGVTALINSVTKIDSALYTVGFGFDVMLHPSSVQGEDGLSAFYSVLKTYMEKGGASIHFNIFDEKMLLDAQQNPQKYESLQVRVCGWNILWNNMDKKEQDEYILRARNIK